MKRVLVILLALIVLFLGALWMLPALVPMDALRGKIEGGINEQITGKAEISSMRLSVFPWLGIRINGLHIQNGPRFKESDLLLVQNAGVRIKVMPLMQGKILGEIVVDKPVIRMETLADGTSSLAAISKPAAAAPKGTPPEKTAEKPSPTVEKLLAGLQIASLKLTEGELRSFAIDAKGDAKPGMDIRRLDVHLTDLALKGRVPTEIKAAVFNPDNQDFRFEGILVTDINPATQTNSLQIESASLHIGEILMKLSGLYLQKQGKPATLDLKANAEGISLGRLAKDLPTMKGKLPEGLEGDLDLAITASGPATAEDLLVKLTAKSHRLATGSGQKMELKETNLAVTYKNNVAKIDELETHAYEGTITTKGTITLPGPKLDLATTIKDLDLQQAANANSQKKDLLFGKANLNVDLAGNMAEGGAQGHALAPLWLNAKGHLSIGKGRLATLNLLADSLQALLKVAPLSPEARKLFESHDWNSMDADFRTEKGTVFLEPAKIQYPQTTSVSIAGSIDPASAMNFKGALVLDKKHADLLQAGLLHMQDKQGNVVLPLRISGTVEKPLTYVDVGSILKNAAKEEIKKYIPPEAKSLVSDLLKPPPKK